jgi:hypothetical protein
MTPFASTHNIIAARGMIPFASIKVMLQHAVRHHLQVASSLSYDLELQRQRCKILQCQK